MSTFQIFVDGCTVALYESEKDISAAQSFTDMHYPKRDGYFYTNRPDGTIRVEHVESRSIKSPISTGDSDPYAGRLFVIHAEEVRDIEAD